MKATHRAQLHSQIEDWCGNVWKDALKEIQELRDRGRGLGLKVGLSPLNPSREHRPNSGSAKSQPGASP